MRRGRFLGRFSSPGGVACYSTNAFGVISEELDGCYVSGEFPNFVPVPGRVDVKFLKYWFRLPSAIARVDEDCSGRTPLTRNRFKENFFLALQIPLPPLAARRRVVARIEELAAEVQEARTLRHQAAEEVEALVGARASSVFRSAMKNGNAPLGSVAEPERGRFHHRPRTEPRFFGGEHPWIQIGEIESSNNYIRNWSQTLNDDGLAISKKFPRGTVFLRCASSFPTAVPFIWFRTGRCPRLGRGSAPGLLSRPH